MVFSSLSFLFLFLPALLAVYYLVPRRHREVRNAVLLLFSLVFYAWGEPRYALLMVLTILGFYVCGLGIGRSGTEGRKKRWLSASVLLGLGALAVFNW